MNINAPGGDGTNWAKAKNSLLSAIETAAADPTELACRGAAAHQRACTEFALVTIISAYDGLYREALA